MKVDSQRYIVVSDLHIGLACFQRSQFLSFIQSLDRNIALILNGDTIDNPYQRLNPKDNDVIDILREESLHRQITWIYGNHDVDYKMKDPGKIIFTRHVEIEKRLMIIHGDDFAEFMQKTLWLLKIMRWMHDVRIALGAYPVHVAASAKKWLPLLYRLLTEEVKKNAVLCAIENGFEAITCGHVHYMEDSLCENVRYINTGTWTEKPLPYILVTENEVSLKTFNS